MIKLTELTRKFGEYTAVDNLNIEIHKGELFGFLGPNGAGKTTTIKMITGILHPTSGTVEIGGIDMRESPVKAKEIIGYVPDDPFLYGRLTGWEYLQFVGGLYNMETGEIKRRAEELFEMLDIGGWIDNRCEEYSHGMSQKLVFCSALLHRPKVLVVDEPMVGLDPRAARRIKDILRQYAAAGHTVFVSTHVLSVAEELCNRIGIINHGRLIGLGTLAELKKRVADQNINLETLFLDLIGAGEKS